MKYNKQVARQYYLTVRVPKRLKLKYGISIDKYFELINKQKNKCAICGNEMKKPHIDHNHKLNKVRGLLCFSCNSMLGLVHDNLFILNNAIGYLLKHL